MTSKPLAQTAKPFVQAACICEKVLREQDGVFTLVRIVDTLNVEAIPGPLPEGYKAIGLPLTLFVSLKAGDVGGEHAVGVRLTQPDGTAGAPRTWPVRFNGQEHGVTVQMGFALDEPQPGLYWFEVMWGDDVLSRVPLRVAIRSAAEPAAASAHAQTTPSPS